MSEYNPEEHTAEHFATCLSQIMEMQGMTSAELQIPIYDSDEFWCVTIERYISSSDEGD